MTTPTTVPTATANPTARSSVTTKALAGFLAAFVLLSLVGWCAYRAAAEAAAAAQWVVHTQEVRAKLGRLDADVSAVEASARNYILTGSPADRDSYQRDRDTAAQEAAALIRLVGDNPAQLQQAEKLQSALHECLTALDRNLLLFAQSGLAAAQAQIAGGAGRQAMLSVRAIAGKMEAAEAQLLAVREADATHDRSKVLVFLVLTLTVAAVGFALLFRAIWRDIAERKRVEATLEHERYLLRTLMDHVPADIYFKDRDSRFLRNNRAHARRLGCDDPALMVGKTDFDFFGPEHAAQALADEQQVIRTAEPVHKEEMEQWPDGRVTWALTVKLPLRDKNGEIAGTFGISHDITKRKQAEAALRASEENLAVTLQSIGDAVLVTDAAGRITRLNAVAEQLIGWTQAEAAGRPVEDVFYIVNEETRAPAFLPVGETLAQGTIHGLANHTLLIARDGTERPIADSCAPIRNRAGEVTGAVLVFRDVTEEKATEMELRRRRAVFENLFESLPGLYLVLTPELEIAAVSNAYLQATMTKREAIVGHGLFEIFPDNPNDHTATGVSNLRASLDRVRRSGVADTMAIQKYDVRRPDGIFEERYWSPINSPVFGSERQIEYIIHRVEDVTDFVRQKSSAAGGPAEFRARFEQMEATIFRNSQELESANRQLHVANAELARASKLKDEFLANMSHELRTPLNAILGLSESLLEQVGGPLTPRQVKSVTTISTSGQHLLALINDILDLSKVEAGKLELHPEPLKADDFCQDCLLFIRTQAMQKTITVAFEYDGGAEKFAADPKRFKQILVNLLTNAVKFTPAGGRVGLTVSVPDGENVVRFTVWDTGIGIAAEDQSKLFRAFTQIDSGLSRAQEGTGLGLALVAKLVELHGGSLTLESQPNHGSRFIVTLPQIGAHRAEPSRKDNVDRRGYRRALIIEDDPTACEQLSRYLTELGLSSVVHPLDDDIIGTAIREQPDILLLDVLLPRESGWVMLAKLKEHPRTRDIPVVMISVVDEPEKSRALGAAAHFIKPVTREQLAVFFQRPLADTSPSAAAFAAPAPVLGPIVLLAEDNEANIETIGGYLTEKGYAMHYARNGVLAVKLARELQPALILMDIQMPVLDGLTAIRQIRADASLEDIPIVALTALAMLGDRERCLAAGATDYMSKPVSLKALAALVARLLATGASDDALSLSTAQSSSGG